MQPFAVERVRRGEDVVLTVRGELDIATAPALQAVLAAARTDEPRRLIVDLTATDFIDSTGSRTIALAARGEGPDVELVCPAGNREVHRVLDFVGLLAVLRVHETLPADLAPGQA